MCLTLIFGSLRVLDTFGKIWELLGCLKTFWMLENLQLEESYILCWIKGKLVSVDLKPCKIRTRCVLCVLNLVSLLSFATNEIVVACTMVVFNNPEHHHLQVTKDS